MSNFFRKDVKRNVNLFSIIVVIALCLSCAGVLQIGIENFKAKVKSKADFLEIEKRKVDHYVSHFQYGVYGFRILLDYSPLFAIFQNSTATSTLDAFLDSGVRLKISKPQNDGNIFERPTGGSLDLSWFKLFVLSIVIGTWAWFCFRKIGYLKFQIGLGGVKRVYLAIIKARIFLTTVFLTLIFGTTYLSFLFNGITLTANEIGQLLIFLFMALMLMVVMLVFGSVFGTIKDRRIGRSAAILLWLIVVVFWPELINAKFSISAHNMKSRYQNEISKLRIKANFEKLIIEKIRIAINSNDEKEVNRKLMETYLKDGFKKVQEIEQANIDKIRKKAKMFHFVSIFNPVTFYKSVNNEISSRGYNSYLEYYEYCKEKHREFVRFCFNNRLYKKNPKVEPFLKDNEYFFQAKPSLPAYSGWGILVQFFWITLGLVIGFFRFKKIVFASQKDFDRIDLKDFDLEKGKINAYYAKSQSLTNVLFTLFSTQQFDKFKEKTTEIAKSKPNFTFICRPDEVPGNIKVKDFACLYAGKEKQAALDNPDIKTLAKKTFAELPNHKRFAVLLSILKYQQNTLFLIDDINAGLPDDYSVDLKDAMNELIKQNNIVIYINRSSREAFDMKKIYHEGSAWEILAQASKQRRELIKKYGSDGS